MGIICYAFKQFSEDAGGVPKGEIANSMFICVFLQLIYIAKFFWCAAAAKKKIKKHCDL